MSTSPSPTRGQQRVLQFAGRANRRMRGQRTASGESEYRIVEVDASQERIVQTVHPRMVASLLATGWIAVAHGTRMEWEYAVTEAGIAAANAPALGE